MLTAKLNIKEIIGDDGLVKVSAQPLLTELIEQYPYYHAARMLLLKLLYQQHDPQFNEELRKAALYLPSRTKLYYEIEGDTMKPHPIDESAKMVSSHRRKSLTPIEKASSQSDRTGELLDIYFNNTPSVLVSSRSGRPVDATTDYMDWLLSQDNVDSKTDNNPDPSVSENETTSDRISDFIKNQGDKRIKLSDKQDDELQKPVISEVETNGQQGAFTETLARIYIKQGKFEQAIEIIRRLSLKYPKKNRYFADQIRFLEKIILNNQAKKS